jgi:hypothetical protein
MKILFTAILVILSFSQSFITAQTTAEKKPSPQWWLSSSLADTVDQYLFHAEAQYSYTKMTGSVAGEIQSGSAQTAIRKDIFTNHMEYFLDKTELALQSLNMNYSTASQAFTDYLDVDITRLIYSEGGFIWERDNTLYIQNRYSVYAGLGLNGVLFEKHYLKVLFALGSVNQQYTVPVDNIDVEKGAYKALYIRQLYKYVIDPRLSVMEETYYLNNMTHSNRYRIGVNLNLNINIVQPVSIILGYGYKFDKESELLGAVPTNTTQSIGIRLSL